MSIVVDCVEGPRLIRQNVMYRSMRRTASRTAYNIKKKACDFEKQVRHKNTLHELNESVVTPKVNKTPMSKRLNRHISQKLQDAALAGRKMLNIAKEDKMNVNKTEVYRNSAVINSPFTGRTPPRRRGIPALPATPDSLKMDLISDNSPSPLSKIVRRAMEERKCKIMAKDKIRIMCTPKKRIGPRGRFCSPRQLHVEVNALAQGLQDLHHTAAVITKRRIHS